MTFSQPHLVENIQVYQSTKTRAARERGKKQAARAPLFLEAVWRQATGLPSILCALVCGFCQLYTCWQTLPTILPSVSAPVPEESCGFGFLLQST